MPEKLVVAAGVKVWHLLASIGATVIGLVYWTGRKEEKYIAEQRENRRRIVAIEEAKFITKEQVVDMFSSCEGRQRLETSSAIHEVQLSLHDVNGKLDHVCSWIEKQEKDR